MKKILAVILMIALAFSLFACTSSQPPEESKKDETTKEAVANDDETEGAVDEVDDIYIAVLPKAFVGDFWKTVELGAIAAAEEKGVKITFEGPDTETDIDQQIKLVESAIAKKADVIALACLDSEGLIPAIESAHEAGIKIITFNSMLNSDIPLTHIATDNWNAGELAGKALAEAVGGKGKFAIIGAVESVKNNRDRSDGAADYIAKNYPDMELITIQYTEGDLNKSLAVATDIITANPDIAGIFSNNETTTIGVATVLEEKGKIGEIQHVGFDATAQTIGYLEDDVTASIITQVPFNMGYLTVINAIDAYNGKDLEDIVDTGVAVVTKDNLSDPDIQKIIDPLNS